MSFSYIKFYPADYLADTRALSQEAKGTWMDILCYLSLSESPGELTHTLTGWSRIVGCSKRKFRAIFDEFSALKIAEFSQEGEQLTIKSRRMIKDWEDYSAVSEKRRNAGKKGGLASGESRSIDHQNEPKGEPIAEANGEANASNVLKQNPSILEARSQKHIIREGTRSPEKRFVKPSLDELRKAFEGKGLSTEDASREAETFLNYYESNGWKVNRNPMKSWPHSVANWVNRRNDFGRQPAPAPAAPTVYFEEPSVAPGHERRAS